MRYVFLLSLGISLFAIAGVSPTFKHSFIDVGEAKVGQRFTHTLAGEAISPDRLPIRYSLSNCPSWMGLEGSEEFIYGTPMLADAGDFNCEVKVTDTNGLSAFTALSGSVVR